MKKLIHHINEHSDTFTQKFLNENLVSEKQWGLLINERVVNLPIMVVPSLFS